MGERQFAVSGKSFSAVSATAFVLIIFNQLFYVRKTVYPIILLFFLINPKITTQRLVPKKP